MYSLYDLFSDSTVRSSSVTETMETSDNIKVDDEQDPWSECNVILLPLLIFLMICTIILFAGCKYKLCKKPDLKNDDK